MKAVTLFRSLLFFVIFFFGTAQDGYAQASLKWYKTFGTWNHEAGGVICADSSGNSYEGGSYWDSINICGSYLTHTGQIGAGMNYYITKLDSNGNCIWQRALRTIYVPGGGLAGGISFIRYLSGSIYLAGSFTGKMIAGNDTLSTTNSTYGYSLFVLKFDINGNYIWGKAFCSSWMYNAISSLYVNPKGIYFCGDFGGSMTIGTTTLSGAAFGSTFYGKMSLGGNYLWAKCNTTQGPILQSLVVDNNQDIYMAGAFSGSAQTIGSYSLTGIPGNWSSNTFIVRCDSVGNYTWVQGGFPVFNGNMSGQQLFLHEGTVYLNLQFDDTVSINAVTFTATPAQVQNLLLKIKPAGLANWSKKLSTNIGGRIASTNTGFVQCSVLNGSATIGSNTLISNGSDDFLFTHYDTTGTVTWHVQYGGSGWDHISDIAYCKERIYSTGAYQGTLSIAGTPIPNYGGMDVFTVKFSVPTVLTPSNPVMAGETSGVDGKLKLYPNPSKEAFNLELSVDFLAQSVKIFNLYGVLVKEFVLTENHLKFEIDSPGFYIMKISSGKGTEAIKFIKSQ